MAQGAVGYRLLPFKVGGRIYEPIKPCFSFCLFCVVAFLSSGCMFASDVLGLVPSGLRQDSGREKRLRNDLFCVE